MGDGYQEVQEVISIHAPTRGATSLKATEYKLSIDFNPRSHERSDKSTYNSFCPRLLISIHAPTRGATRSRFFVTIKVDFNPRSHERSDQDSMQSVRSRHHFNPRSHERSDVSLVVTSIESAISIHAPTRGATGVYCYSRPSHKFQSTLPREERLTLGQ